MQFLDIGGITWFVSLGAVMATVVGLLWKHVQDKRNEKKSQKRDINLLFGELMSLLAHYIRSSIPLGSISEDYEFRKKLCLAKYDSFPRSITIDKYSILPANSVSDIFQLALKVRNVDRIIDLVLEKPEDWNLEEVITDINYRMYRIVEIAEELLEIIADKEPEYRKLLREAKKHASEKAYR